MIRPLAAVRGSEQSPACLYFTGMVKCGEDWRACMQEKTTGAKSMKTESTALVRATLSFPPDVYESLKVIARQKKVSLAWVMREAAEQYLAEKWPLFKRQG